MLTTHRELEIWRRSFQLCKSVCKLTGGFPNEERFGLSAQMRRAAVSVPSNIAEGYNRGSTRDYIRFLWIGNASLAELETQGRLSLELGFIREPAASALIAETAEIGKMIRAIILALRNKNEPDH